MAFRKVAAPTQDDALKEAEDHVALLHATDDGEKGGLTGIFCPREVDTVHDALGIAARWQGVTQDVDYERKLLVRALLQALPPGFVTLPEGCAALDDFDLAPVKVQPLLEALAARRRIDLATPEFRWDVKQPPPTFTWWGSKEEGQDHVPPPYGGLSRRQLEIAALEAVLLAFDETAAASEADQGLVQDRRLALRSLAANLGVGSKQKKALEAALSRREELGGGEACGACGVRRRLRVLQANFPADFETDNDFFNFQERQAALIGASLHAMLHNYARDAGFDDIEESPAAGLEALIDALFMELLSIAHPTVHGTVLRRSAGFDKGEYAACLQA